MAVFICARTKLGKCTSLGDQVRVIALRRQNGWQAIREDLAQIAEEWFGRDPVTSRLDMRAVCAEVFRID
ncbi:hypothetical protein [Pseudomonas sp. Marseille-P9655]|jgi:hypothetical protein|uniref:hypothetical protein n=1 Tax=Pseudomonas sp. Marseille-P9655 TaxID=2866591 RepID=UPI001CE47630|nr:hypothetical protein [Pseudomonas sp. Marseille-P9655]